MGRNGFTFESIEEMEETRDDAGPSEPEPGPSNSTWWPSGFMEKFHSVSLVSPEETLNSKESASTSEQDDLSFQTASQILWTSGTYTGPIPNGFYSVIPVSSCLCLSLSKL